MKTEGFNRKGFILLVALAMLFCFASVALAKGDISPSQHTKVQGTFNPDGNGDYLEYVQEINSWYEGAILHSLGNYVDSFNISAHPQGTWNSPYTAGIDGFNYNDPQDYVKNGDQDILNGYRFRSGPHGGYLTTTHKCRECHAVHRAAGKFKLLRSDTRFEACDWCHGTGAGSGFNIQMDNNDAYTEEYNVGHTMGFGIESGKWKAPDDTYPAYTPNYWQGGFSCFDCHSPHANPARMLGYDDNGQVKGLAFADTVNNNYNGETRYYSIINPGHGTATDQPGAYLLCIDCHKKKVDSYSNFVSGTPSATPLYQSGSWLLIKNADREMAETSEVISYYKLSDALDTPGATETVQIVAGEEISDMIYAHTEIVNGEPTVTAGQLHQFNAGKAYPVNKIPIDWNTPVGIAQAANGSSGFDLRSAIPYEPSHALIWNISEFCTDCHDGNAGLHTVAAPLFSEDRALRNQGDDSDNWKGNYDVAYGHDENSRHCGRQMQFNPEDSAVFGPNCRNCHKGSSACGRCHSESSGQTEGGADNYNGIYLSQPPYTEVQALSLTAMNNYDRIPEELRFEMVWNGYTWEPTLVSVDEYPGIQGASMLHVKQTSTGESNMVFDYVFAAHGLSSTNQDNSFMFKKSRTANWYSGWREATGFVQMGKLMSTGAETGTGVDCSDDGFSWPHRTLGWKMLKDDLFGLDFVGNTVNVGDTRSYDTDGSGVPETYTVHDLDSVCLDCHNPTVWRATSASDHTDDPATYTDDHDDELLTRGLP